MKLYSWKFISKVAAITLFMGSSAWATPAITSVTVSTMAQKGTLIINGTGFGTKSPAKPELFADYMEDIYPSSVSVITTWNGNDNLFRTNSCNSLWNTPWCVEGTWMSSASARSFSFDARDGTFSNVYDSGFRYFDFAVPMGSGQKNWRLWSPVGSSHDFVQSTNANGIALNECTSQSGTSMANGNLERNNWNFEEHIWTHGTVTVCDGSGAGDGTWTWKENGITRKNKNDYCNCTDDHNQYRVWDNFTASDNLPADGSHVWQAFAYMDTTPSKVYLSTSATSSGTFVKIPQPPTFWSSTGTVSYVNIQGLDTSKTIYAYVVDSAGNVNANGAQVGTSNNASQLAPFIVPIVQVSSFSVNWSSAGASYVAVMSDTSDFSHIVTSGALVPRTTSYTNLAQHTSYYFQVKVATMPDNDYSAGISTATPGTSFIPSIGSITQTSLVVTYTSVGSAQIGVLATDSGFSSIVSSGAVTTPKTFSSLTCNTQYFYEMKVSSETAYDGNMANATTSACSSATSSPAKISIGGIKINGVIFK